MPTILNMLDRNDAAKAERYLKQKNVELVLNAPIVEVAEDHIKLKDGSTIPTYTLIWTAGVKGTSDAADFGLETARGFRLVANEYMEAKGYEDKKISISLVTWSSMKNFQIHQHHKSFKPLNKLVIQLHQISSQRSKVAKNTNLKEITKDSWYRLALNGA